MAQTSAKRIGLIRKKPGLTQEEFLAHWLGVHVELGKRLPGLRRYVVNVIDRERFPSFGYDGFSEIWFDSEEALEAAYRSPQGIALLADLANFVDQIEPLVADEHIIV